MSLVTDRGGGKEEREAKGKKMRRLNYNFVYIIKRSRDVTQAALGSDK